MENNQELARVNDVNAANSQQQVATTNNNEVSATITQELLEASAGLAKLKPVITLSPKYLELAAPGDSFRGLYWGLTKITVNDQETGEQKTIEAAAFLVDKCIRINAGVSLVTECKNSGATKGAPLEVTFSEKKGKTKIYSLTLLG